MEFFKDILIKNFEELSFILNLISLILAFMIFIKSWKINIVKNSKDLIFITSGFFLVTLFIFLEILSNSAIKNLLPGFDYVVLSFFYRKISNFFIAVSIFLNMLNISNFNFYPGLKNIKNIIIFILLMIMVFGAGLFLLEKTYTGLLRFIFYEIFIFNSSVSPLGTCFLFLSVFLFIESRKYINKINFIPITIALMLLILKNIIILAEPYISYYIILTAYVLGIISFLLIYTELKNVAVKSEIFRVGQKFLIYTSFYLFCIYIIFRTIVVYALSKANFPIEQYIFLIFYLLNILITYMVSVRISRPINSLINQLKILPAGLKPSEIKVDINDEFCLLASKINNLNDQKYRISQELILSQKKIESLCSRQRLVNRIIFLIRDLLDEKELKEKIITWTAKLLNASRCFILDYDYENNKFFDINHCYMAHNRIKDLVGQKITNFPQEIISIFLLGKGIQWFSSLPEEYALKVENLIMEAEIKSSMIEPIFYKNKFLGLIVVQYEENLKDQKYPWEESIILLKTIAVQTGIVLNQINEIKDLKVKASNEEFLRKFILELKISQDAEEILTIILKNLKDILNPQKACYIEMPEEKLFTEEKTPIKYLVYKNCITKKTYIPTSNMWKYIYDFFSSEEIISVDDAENEIENQEILKLLKNDETSSFMLYYLKKNHLLKKFEGLVYIACKKPRVWKEQEKELFKTIIDNSVNILWEIEKIRETKNLRSIFIYTLAHDLRVPFLGEQRTLEFILSRPDKDNIAKYKGLVREILESNKKLGLILEKFIDIFSYESNTKILFFQSVDIDFVLMNIVNSLKKYSESKSIDFIINIQEDIPRILADPSEIYRPFKTIIENAIKYSPVGQKIEITCYKRGNFIETCIKDHGPGISEQTKSIIYDKYYAVKKLEREIGTGLSLYLAKQIIEAHKGKLIVESELEKGSTFYVILPIYTEPGDSL
jgi:signal transduction histidine kinase